ncbi:MAG: GGDEF domain-containing protein [Gammaproteobacteria bacterium]|nr:GGDEF domain-containing protein [Gammaproteobacteria bacterium]
MSDNSYQFLNRKALIDIVLIIIVNIIAFLIFAEVDALEWLYKYSIQHEEYELDEVITLFFTLSITLAIFSIRRWLEIIELLKVMKSMAIKDPLTGIFNRRYLNDALTAEIKRAKRTGETFSLIMIDIDYFKKINDLNGHSVGDKVLCQFVKILIHLSRESDIVSRWGGEEFLILCPDTKLKGAINLGEKILQAIRDFQFEAIGHMTASIGVADFTSMDTLESIVNRVDNCLYEAKNKGRDSIISTLKTAEEYLD